MVRPKARKAVDLAGQMAVYDANYHRIMQLMPAMASEDHREFAVDLAGGRRATFRLQVLERCKYTTMLEVRQLQTAGGWQQPAHFTLRVYHDARSAEVTGYRELAHFKASYEYPNPKMLQRDEKQQLNRFLAEWLSHCLRHGYAHQHRLDAGDPCELTDN